MAAVLELVFNAFPLVRAASMFPLVNLTKVSMAAPFHVFSKSLFQLGSQLILVTAPELTASTLTPTSKDHGR